MSYIVISNDRAPLFVTIIQIYNADEFIAMNVVLLF